MLPLVLADRDLLGAVEQDVGCHQHRIGEQPDAGVLGALLRGLVLELRHATGLAEAGHAGQHPRQFDVLGHLALHEQHRPVRVDTDREQLRGGDQHPLAQFLRVLRHGDRVQVRDEVIGVELVLHRHPLLQRTEEVPEVEGVRGGLNAGQHPRPGGRRGGVLICSARHALDTFTHRVRRCDRGRRARLPRIAPRGPHCAAPEPAGSPAAVSVRVP